MAMAGLNGIDSRRKQTQRRQADNVDTQHQSKSGQLRFPNNIYAEEEREAAEESSRLSGRENRPRSARSLQGTQQKRNSLSFASSEDHTRLHGHKVLFPPLVSASPDRNRDAQAHASSEFIGKGHSAGHSMELEPSSVALLGAVSLRLQQLEETVKTLRAELVSKDRALLVANREAEERDLEVDQLLVENRHLRAQIHDMESFLADYGLIWVGSSPPKQKDASNDVDDALSYLPSEAFPVDAHSQTALDENSTNTVPDFAIFFSRIAELNILMEADKAQVVKSNDGTKARLEFQKGIPLVVYADGISVKDGPFRPYVDLKTQAFIKDILDGYFPDEFKEEYPDGVVLHAVDKREEAANIFLPFTGKGNTLQDSKDPRIVNMHQQLSLSAKAPEPAPKKIAEYGDSNFNLIMTPALKELQLACLADPSECSSARRCSARDVSEQLTTLQIKFDGGNLKAVMIKMRFQDTIESVHKEIERYLKTVADFRQLLQGKAYELRTPYPNKAYTNMNESLVEAGLVPNATLILRWK